MVVTNGHTPCQPLVTHLVAHPIPASHEAVDGVVTILEPGLALFQPRGFEQALLLSQGRDEDRLVAEVGLVVGLELAQHSEATTVGAEGPIAYFEFFAARLTGNHWTIPEAAS